MTDSYALLADATERGTKRTPLLKTDDEGYTFRATVMHSDGDQLLLIRAWLYDKYAYVAIDQRGSILATATGEVHPSTDGRIRDELDRKRIPLGSRDEEYSLLADHVDGPRRTSVLKADDGMWSMRVKLIDSEDETLAQVRVEVYELGYVHIVLGGEGGILAMVTGGNDSDAWDRLRGELRRRGVELA